MPFRMRDWQDWLVLAPLSRSNRPIHRLLLELTYKLFNGALVKPGGRAPIRLGLAQAVAERGLSHSHSVPLPAPVLSERDSVSRGYEWTADAATLSV